MSEEWREICERFQRETSYDPATLEERWQGRTYDPAKRPDSYLQYPEAALHLPLGEPRFPQSPDLWTTIRTRRSLRNFTDQAISLEQLNLLLWGTQGITAEMGGYQLRAVPSAGALFPIETYLLVARVEGLEAGIYHLDVRNWALEGLSLGGDPAAVAKHMAMGQEMAGGAAVNFVWTAVLERARAKYYERAYRYVYLDAGHISQNLYIVGTALQLGVACIGAFYDSEAHRVLGIDGRDHCALMMSSVGHVSGRGWKEDRRPDRP